MIDDGAIGNIHVGSIMQLDHMPILYQSRTATVRIADGTIIDLN